MQCGDYGKAYALTAVLTRTRVRAERSEAWASKQKSPSEGAYLRLARV